MKASQPVSEKKAAANRRNARKSTGPKTLEGKNRSKLNALQHGLRSAITILPTEDAAAFEARKVAWTEELQPAGDFEAYLVDLVVANSWRLDRCRRAEASLLQTRGRDAREAFDRAIADRNRALIEELPDAPARAAARLRETFEGTLWMIGRLEWHNAALDCRGYWEPSEKDEVLNLLGKSPSGMFTDQLVQDISEAFLNSGWIDETDPDEIVSLLNLDLYPPKGMKTSELHRRLEGFVAARERAAEAVAEHEHEFDPGDRARKDLTAIMNRELEGLRPQLARLQAKEALDRAEAAVFAGCDVSPAGQALARYEASQRRAFHSAIRDLLKHRESAAEAVPSVPLDPEQAAFETTEPETFGAATAAVAPNEPTEVPGDETQSRAAKKVAIVERRVFGKAGPALKSALSEVRGYGGAAPLDPARWLADQEYYQNELMNDALYNP